MRWNIWNTSNVQAPAPGEPFGREGAAGGGLPFAPIHGLSARSAGLIGIFAVIIWLLTGVYKVQPDEQGVVLRFGKWVDTTEPGLHYHLPYPVDQVLLPKVTQSNQLQLGEIGADRAANGNQMLTGDENIVEADCAVSWRIKDLRQYLFMVSDPEAMLKTAADSAVREVIAQNPIQSAMSDKRQLIADQIKDVLQRLLDSDRTGITITQVQLERVDPPSAVIDAFNDVQRARADQERARNEAESYRNDIIPKARGEAERISQDAQAYKTQVVNLAQGEAQSFLAVYQSYARAKDVTAWRLYLESMDEVLKKAGKVIVDSSGKGVSAVAPYLPLSGQDVPPAPSQSPGGGK